MKKLILSLFACSAMLASAGGPFERFADGSLRGQDTSRPFVWNIDIDDLNPTYNNAAATVLVRNQFAQWRDLPGTRLQIQEGPRLPINVTTAAEMQAMLNQGFSPIVMDQGNALLQEIGLTGGVIAAAGPRGLNNQTGERLQMIAIIGGAATNGRLEGDVSATLLHEFGHGLGLGHSVVNGEFFAFNGNVEGFGRPPETTVEVMYWQAVATVPFPNVDDASGYLALYGTGNGGWPGRGTIEGRVLLPDGFSGADGVNVVVRDISGGDTTIFTNAASTVTWNTPQGNGYYRIPALPPGEYIVEVNDLADGNTGSYSDPVRTNGGLNNTVLGPFPGDAEYYNGANESSNPLIDDPTERTTVTVVADQVTSGIDIIFNRQEGEQGTLFPMVYNVPEVQTEGDQETRIGIVNPGDDTRSFDIYGFDALGNQVGQVGSLGNTIAGKSRIWFDVETAFGDAGTNVHWIQIGSDGEILVYAEFGGPGTITAYWSSQGASGGLFMPHVAKNTTGFATFMSAVNPTNLTVTGTATEQPGGDDADLPELATAFAQAFYNVIDLFGADLSAVDWVQLTGTGGNGAGIAAMEYFVGLPDETRVASLGLTGQSGTTLRFLHVAADVNSFWTGLVYMNVGGSAASVTETYYDTAGAVITTRNLNLGAGAKIDPLLLFDINNTEPAGTAWIEVTSDQPLVGYELFGSPFANENVNYFAGLQGVYSGGANLYYPHVQSGNGSFTGVVALNIGDEASDITFTAWDDAGNALATATVPDVGPKNKITRLVNGLFTAETAENTRWVSASTTASTWAGFELWGGTDGQTLSGINAVATGINTSGDGTTQIVMEVEDNNTLDTAQVLTSIDGVWDINVIGFMDGAEANTPVDGAGDDIEDIYTFTLEEETALVIAVSPDNGAADFDLFLTLGQQTITGQRVTGLRTDPEVDWSAWGTGDETLAGIYPPGTYYVYVSSWDDSSNLVTQSDYGLVITEVPLFLETFETDDFLTNWGFSVFVNDSDGLPLFQASDGLNNPRFGRVLDNPISDGTGSEEALALTPFFTVPETNLTVFDVDAMYLYPVGPAPASVSFGVTETTFGTSSFALSSYNPAFSAGPIIFSNISLQTSGWVPWSSFNTNRASVIVQSQPGSNIGLGLGTSHNTGRQIFDNLRAVGIVTTMNANSKRAGEIAYGSRGKSLQQKQLMSEIRYADPVQGNVTVQD